MSLRIAIVGAGGVGGLLGARLARHGQRVGFVVRRERVQALRAAGLHVTAPDGEFRVADVEATDQPAELGAVDVVVLCTKAYDLAASAAAVAPLVADDTFLVTLQNGVDAEEIVRRRLPRARLLPGLAYVVSKRVATGELLQASPFFRLAFGVTEGVAPPAAKPFEAACRAAGIEASLVDDIVAQLWTKLVFIASASAVTCTTNRRLGPLRSDPSTRATLVQAMHEVVAVGRARGVAIPADAVERAVAVLDSLPPDATTSMHEDLLAGRPLEVDHLSCAVARLGRERGVSTPVHSAACARLK